ncbi:DoxX family protein [Leptospira fainei serovar Hurstbridge str. BUT 6]|uniref:DoxX family protein n=1 Tax=Leptospira fainei serovar Hurstbridge str. BUT 6 TaxID=1193011 RepID=S3V538_9LEPT|nr:DoxX family protein [Leptospira fainei]EPG75744.1 DoxX family protein [Leptospira fainei serovar Hurstbridge str. BUT 6]
MKVLNFFLKIEDTEHPYRMIIRFLVGGVFLWEGIIKFLYANQGVGRFTKLGFPEPGIVSGFIGGLEIAGGLLLIAGFLTKPIGCLFIIEMIVAMLTTKVPLYFGTSPLASPQAPPIVGIWAVLHEIRSEYAQLLGSLYLVLSGPGRNSIDAILKRRAKL